MRQTASRHYTGSPGETVTVSAEPEGSGAVAFRLDGREQGGSSPFVFRLKHVENGGVTDAGRGDVSVRPDDTFAPG